nr:biotin--protein ligase 2-like isoform X1 [Tanacetum cinerariifolium]
MESQLPCVLVLSGKSASDKEIVESLKENASLKLADDVKMLMFLQSEMERQSEKDEFDTHTYMTSLTTTCFGRLLLWSPILPSTQDVVSLNFSEIPIGSVCIADVQSKGRGRSKNVWESPKGGLLFSFTIQMEDGRVVPLVQYVVCLAVTEAIKDLFLRNTRTHGSREGLKNHMEEVISLSSNTHIYQGTEQRALLQETIERNKVEADRQFAEIMNAIKTLQPPATTPPSTLPPPLHTQPLQSYATMPLQHPYTTTTSLPPTFALTQPLQQPRPTLPSSAAYTSFSGLPFDSQGFPIPYGPNGEFFGLFRQGSTVFYGAKSNNTTATCSRERTRVGAGADYRLRKLKMLLFNGDDIYEWVYLTERFFDIQGLVTSGERLKVAMMCLERPALSWFRWSDNREPFRSWEDLKRGMLVRFQSSQAGSLHEQFFAISQSETAWDYITLFEKMAAQLPKLQEEALEGIFIKGLKQELRMAVRTQKPTRLSQAMELALIIDETSKGVTSKAANRTGGDSSRPPAMAGGAPFKRMTNSEFTDKRAKGLCYRSLQVLLVDDNGEEEKEGGYDEEHVMIPHRPNCHWGMNIQISAAAAERRCRAQIEGIPPLDVRIKWPNDLYLDGLKVGGILCTSTYRSKKFNISAGVGLNVDNDKPTTSLNAALRKLTYDFQLRRENITSAFFNKFEHLFSILMNHGFRPLEDLYYKTWLHSGQRIVVQDKCEGEDFLIENVVTVQGLTSSGYLLAIADNGEMCELHPDGNSFDFFKGLVRRKLT